MADPATTWGAGDYPLMTRRLEPAAVAAIEGRGRHTGRPVLDLATGTGNAAPLAAQRGARVVGIDFEPEPLRLVRERIRSTAIEVDWLPGDLCDLPAPDHCADVVLSVFGMMYASDHARAAREIARVAAPAAAMPAMGRDGVVERQVFATVPAPVECSPSPLGRSPATAVAASRAWSYAEYRRDHRGAGRLRRQGYRHSLGCVALPLN